MDEGLLQFEVRQCANVTRLLNQIAAIVMTNAACYPGADCAASSARDAFPHPEPKRRLPYFQLLARNGGAIRAVAVSYYAGEQDINQRATTA